MKTTNYLEVSEIQVTYKSKVPASQRTKVTNSKDVFEVFRSIYESSGYLEYKEAFYAMYLSRMNKILCVQRISEGTLTGTTVDVRQIVQGALMTNAASMIICHNHPSGNTDASEADKQMTNKINSACTLFDLKLLDSLIITSETYNSMADSGIL